MLQEGNYSTHQAAAWYYSCGLALLLMVVVPNSMDAASWEFNKSDALAVAVAVPVWPACAFGLTFANKHAAPMMVIMFAPAQIVFTFVLDYLRYDKRPSVLEIAGAACVVAGLCLYVSAAHNSARDAQRDCKSSEDAMADDMHREALVRSEASTHAYQRTAAETGRFGVPDSFQDLPGNTHATPR